MKRWLYEISHFAAIILIIAAGVAIGLNVAWQIDRIINPVEWEYQE